MKSTPASKSQLRALNLLKLPIRELYSDAAKILTKAGYQPDGLPTGMSWRQAAKLADSTLLKGIEVNVPQPRISILDLIEHGDAE